MVYVLLTVATLIAGMFLAYIIGRKTLPNGWSQTFDFLLSIIGGFIGIFAALYFTDVQSQAAQKEQISRMLNLTYQILTTYQSEIDNLAIRYKEILDTGGIPKDDSFATYLTERNLHVPSSFVALLSSEFVIQNIVPDSFVHLSESKDTLTRSLDELQRGAAQSTLEEKLQSMINRHRQDIGKTLKLLAVEIGFQNGMLSAKKVMELHQLLFKGTLNLKEQGLQVQGSPTP